MQTKLMQLIRAVTIWTGGLMCSTAFAQGPQVDLGAHPPTAAPQARAVHSHSPYSSKGRFTKAWSLPVPQGTGSNSLVVTLNGRTLPSQAASTSVVSGLSGILNLQIFVPATGATELFMVGVPTTPVSPNAPLLVGFHQLGASHADLNQNTDFFNEAQGRGWYVLAPLSGNSNVDPTQSFSAIEAQINTMAAIEWVCGQYAIDMQRIYGVGFSAGGGIATSMASRYLDPTGPMFAAVINHTGVLDMALTYKQGDPTFQGFLDQLYGVSPASHPFEYVRTSVLQTGIAQQWVPGGDHMAINLGHVPTLIFYNLLDSNLFQLNQNYQLWDWSNMTGATNFQLQTVQDPVNPHRWITLDEVTACNWLAPHTLQIPLNGQLLMDRDARFLQFDLVQSVGDTFSRLTFDGQTAQNIDLLNTLNVSSLAFDPADFGMTTGIGDTFTLNLSAQDSGDTIILKGIASAPINVFRDSLVELNWLYSMANSTLTLFETDAAPHAWNLQF